MEDDVEASERTAIPRISWGAVFAGVIGALGSVLVLGLLGVAIGASSVRPAEGEVQGIGVATGLWTIGTFLVATAFGGWLASRLSGVRRGAEGLLHGVVVWGFVMLLTFTLVGSGVSSALRGALGFLGGAAQESLATVRDVKNPESVFEGLRDRVSEPKGRDEAVKLLTAIGVERKEARDLVAEVGKSVESGQTTPELDKKIESAKQAAAVKAQEATKAIGTGAWWTLFAVVLALGGGLAGGFYGSDERAMKDRGRRPAPSRLIPATP